MFRSWLLCLEIRMFLLLILESHSLYLLLNVTIVQCLFVIQDQPCFHSLFDGRPLLGSFCEVTVILKHHFSSVLFPFVSFSGISRHHLFEFEFRMSLALLLLLDYWVRKLSSAFEGIWVVFRSGSQSLRRHSSFELSWRSRLPMTSRRRL